MYGQNSLWWIAKWYLFCGRHHHEAIRISKLISVYLRLCLRLLPTFLSKNKFLLWFPFWHTFKCALVKWSLLPSILFFFINIAFTFRWTEWAIQFSSQVLFKRCFDFRCSECSFFASNRLPVKREKNKIKKILF